MSLAGHPSRRATGGASHNGAVHVAFTTTDRLGLCNFSDFVAQSHSSHNRCVRFSPAVTGRTCNTRYRAARYTLPGRDFHPLDRASFAWRTLCYRTPIMDDVKNFTDTTVIERSIWKPMHSTDGNA